MGYQGASLEPKKVKMGVRWRLRRWWWCRRIPRPSANNVTVQIENKASSSGVPSRGLDMRSSPGKASVRRSSRPPYRVLQIDSGKLQGSDSCHQACGKKRVESQGGNVSIDSDANNQGDQNHKVQGGELGSEVNSWHSPSYLFYCCC